ncbi:MAG: FUN14 domain-containing protein [Candidatus Bathyarchaeia archaeon]
MSDVLPPIIYQVGLGGFIGFILGFALKKLSKLVLFLIGLFVCLLVYLNIKGILSLNYEALFNFISDFLGAVGSAFSWLVHTIALLPFAASFVAGFLLGLKLG